MHSLTEIRPKITGKSHQLCSIVIPAYCMDQSLSCVSKKYQDKKYNVGRSGGIA